MKKNRDDNMNKRDIIKIIVIILLVGVIGFEVFYFLKKDLKEDNQTDIVEEQEEDLTQYIVDVTKPYYKNGLKLELKEEEGYFYHKISGLKNKKIQDKINQKIKENVKKIYKEAKKDDEEKRRLVTSSITANHSNILSINFLSLEDDPTMENAEFYSTWTGYSLESSLIFDLNTGNELKITDLLSNTEDLKEKITYAAEENITRSIGFEFAHYGYLKKYYQPDYSTVEDSVMSVINQFKKGNYAVSLSSDELYFYIKDVYMPIPRECFEDNAEKLGCKKYKYFYDEEDDETYYVYIDENNIETEIYLTISLKDLKDSLILYNRYEKGNDLYENERKQENRVFFEDNQYGNANTSYISSNDTEHIDYEISPLMLYEEEHLKLNYETIKNSVIKESKELKTKDYNIYIYNGDIVSINDEYDDDREDYVGNRYFYAYFNVTHYDLPKKTYDTLKEKLYLAKYNRAYNDWGSFVFVSDRFDFLKLYPSKKAYYFYIYNEEGKEVSCNDIINPNFDFESYIPEAWLSLGKYKTMDSLVKNAYIMVNDDANIKDRLIIVDEQYTKDIYFKYKGKKAKICDEYDECNAIRRSLYK